MFALLMLAFAGAAQADTSPGGASATPPTRCERPPHGTTTTTGQTGGAGVGAPASAPSTPAHPTVPGVTAKIINGVAYAPSFAPMAVKQIIWAGNQIRHKPYIWGGGHGTFKDAGYDCSGSVSYVLHAAHLIRTSMDSSQFENWGVERDRSVGHGVRQSRARLPRGRRHPPGHLLGG